MTPTGGEDIDCASRDADGYVQAPAGTVEPGESFDLTCSWSLSNDALSRYLATCSGGECKHPQQAVLVELTMAPGATASRELSPQSVWRAVRFRESP